MCHVFDPSQYSLVHHIVRILIDQRVYVTPESKILDFGCGTGGHVYEFRDAGFNAFGFDNFNYVKFRDPGDAALFRFHHQEAVSYTGDQNISAEAFRINYPDDEFDVVFSTSVMEHVRDHELVMAEISRVLKPGGVSLHMYPSRWKLIEPHIYVPLGGVIQNRWWFYLWGLLGIRNEFQQEMSASQVADNNVLYCNTGLKYLRKSEMFEICKRYFGIARFVTASWYGHDSGPFKGVMVATLPGRSFFETFSHCMLFLEENKHQRPRLKTSPVIGGRLSQSPSGKDSNNERSI